MLKRLPAFKNSFLTFIFCAAFLLMPGLSMFGWGQTTQTFTTNNTFTVPAGVTSIQVECWGGGGGGSSITSNGARGGGGGGGAYASSVIAVTSGNTYAVGVGAGGNANTAGSNSTFATTTVKAAGGSGGTNNSTTAGAGGSVANSTGTKEFAGGNGANGGALNSGGGGGGAGNGGPGGNASGYKEGAGTATNGGNGGTGLSGSNNGNSGITYGGGGSGAVTNTSTNRTGGSGANGLVVISWVTVSGISTETCVGGSTGTITATGNGGTTPYTFSIDGTNFQVSGTFSGLAAGTYTITVKDNSALTAFTLVTINPPATSGDDQNAAGSNSWIGHVYDGTNFANYIGHYTQAETFNESFGGNTNCFDVTSNSTTRSIYTETFSVRYRMNSTKNGLYIVDLGSDDGSRLTVDGSLLYNNWNDQSFSDRTGVLMNLKGASSLVYDFYENAGGNRVVFQNFTLLLANNLNTNITQSIKLGATGTAISGDVYGILPAGITVSGTGYQWTYSTTPGGSRNDIGGATGATYTPSTIVAPFNVAGTYYIYRNAILSGTNNVAPNPYTATNESNAATLTISASSSYYSYQTGSWNQSSTWTSDPGGTTQVGSTIPGNNDIVEILSGRTVTLPGNVATTTLDVTINGGSALDLSTFQFTAGLKSLSGQGTLKINSAVFPTPVTTNTFVNAGGGTTEYNAGVNLPSQAVYNNLTINKTGSAIIQTIPTLTLNGDLHVKAGTFQINDNTAQRRTLIVNGNVTVDAGASFTVGKGVTNSTTSPLGITGGTAPFINYYDQQSHRIVLNGDFTNNGTVRFTNLTYPVYNAFPPTTAGATSGFATVYFQGASDNKLFCNGTTDFYNLVLDKGIDETFKLTIYSSASTYANLRLFGANVAGGEGGGMNPNLKKALWIRTGTLVLEGLVVIPSLSEGTNAVEAPVASPNSDYYIPANGALVVNGIDVVVQTTADDYREVNVAYGTTAPSNAAMGISASGTGSSLGLYGKLQMNNGYLTTKESGGIITSSVAPGQFVLNNGTVDTKQFLSATGAASFEQNGGLFLLRGRFQRTPSAFTAVSDLTNAPLNTIRANDASLTASVGTFNMNNANNVFIMTGGVMRIYDVCGPTAPSYAFQVNSSASNINVTGGTIEFVPTLGTGGTADAPIHLLSTTTPLGNVVINRASGTSTVQLSTPLTVLNNLTLTSGVLTANNQDVTIGGDALIAIGTTYTPGTNATIFNGFTDQTFTVNLAAALALNKFTIDKPSGTILNFAGSQKTINVADNFRLALGTLNGNGNMINLAKDVYNSGLHTGAGNIVMNGTIAQVIDGDGNGIFQNLTLNNNTGTAPVSLTASTTINGALTFSQDKLFNIDTYNLKLNAASTIVNGGALRYIQSAGNSGDGGLTKVYSTTTAFTFPIGAPSIKHAAPAYTPAIIGFGAAPTTYGSVTVIPVGYEHPSTTVNGQSLAYFWRVKSSGFAGIPTNTVAHTFVYDQLDVAGTEANYIPSVYNRTAYTWNNGVATNINTGTNTIADWTTPTNSKAFLDGDYTAGDASFGTPKIFYSRLNGASKGNGLWSASATWSYTSNTGAANTVGAVPGINDIVIIGAKDSVYLATNNTGANTDIRNCASLQIETGSALDIGYNPGSSFKMVLSHPNGNGNFRVTTSWNSGNTFAFPSGDFSDFNINLGTTELYSTNPAAGTTYWLPNGVLTYGNLILSPFGGSNIIFPNNSLLIYGNLYTRGQNADSWFCPSWNTAYPLTPTAIVAKTITIKGNLNNQGGSLMWYGNGALAQNIIVFGDVIVSNWGSIQNWGGANNQSLAIGGSLINNTNNALGNGATQTTSKVDFSTNGAIPVTFFGPNNASIANTSGTPGTIFSTLTINKGTSQTTTLTCNIAGTLTTPANNWFTLQNGTFRYMRTNPNTDFTLSTTTALNIPSTAGLYFDYSNTGNHNILIADNASDANDLYLGGKLTVINGNVFIGPVNGTTNNNNDIEYSGGGTSEIEVQGGTLIVNGQIRQNPTTASGILKYTQSGGVVTINGNKANNTNAKLEVLNTGSQFNMSNGVLNILRGGGGNAYGDLFLRPETSTVTGGTINFTNVVPNSVQNYLMDATVPLNNITITGAAGFNATVKLMVNPLALNGNLTLSNARSIFDANSAFNINVSIKGDFTNNGAYNHFSNLTTFNAGASNNLGVQSLSGTSATDFYDLTVSPVTKLILNKDITVNRNISLTNGTLVGTTFKTTVKGDVANNANYTNTTASGGMLLNSNNLQQISGTGTFGQLELNNAAGATILNDITLQSDLILTSGIFDINTHLLTLGQNSNLIPSGTPYSTTKMITSDGVWSNIGILKVFGIIGSSTTFTYPLGVPGKYTPAVITIDANATVGSIRVNNISRYHPAVIDPANVLNYFWEIQSIGISGFSGNFLLKYLPSDVVGGPESTYIAAQLLTPSTNWSKATTGPGTDNVNETNHTITFNYTGSSNLTGEYTAGNDAAIPNIIPQYTSNATGNWTNQAIWTPSGGTSYPCPVGGPNGFIVTINHEVTANANYCFAYKTYINNKLKMVSPYYGHNLGSVYGNGTLYLENAVFPAGRFDAFLDCSGSGTLEYGGTGTYDVNADLYAAIPNISFSGTGTRVLPNKDITVCKQLLINGPSLDNSNFNRKLTIQGSMVRTSGAFISGTGTGATVSFAGSAPQMLAGFTATNAFNNFEINNISGLTLNGSIDIANNLLLTNGLITTSASNKLTITNPLINCVFPIGGSSNSFIDGPLVKRLNQGDPSFKFPIGKKGTGLGNKLAISATKTGTLLWTAQYFNPNIYSTYSSPLTAINTKEYWTLSGVPSNSEAMVELGWDPVSDLTPLMTQNGLSDMRVAQHNGTDWVEVASETTSGSDNLNGSVETANRVTLASGSGNFTVAVVNTPKPRIRMTPAGAICGTAGIPVSLTSSLPIVAPFTVNYTENGVAKSISPASFPATIPTIAGGATYRLTGFTYNYPAGTLKTGVFDVTPVISSPVPTNATVGASISTCGGSSALLTGNNPAVGTGLWTILSGAGGSVTNPTQYNSGFTGTNGSGYTLRWTISSGACTSSADLAINFPLLPITPAAFTTSTSTVCQGQNSVAYIVTNDPTATTYNWSYSGTGASIVGATNSIIVNFSSAATNGILSVSVSNGCGTSAARTMAIIVNPATAISSQSTAAQTTCIGGTFTAISVTATGTAPITYQWYSNTTASTTGGISLAAANGAQTSSYTPQAAAVGTLYYYCTVTGTCGIVKSAVSGVFIVNPIPTVTYSVDYTTVCQNDVSPVVTFNNPQNLPITVTIFIVGIGDYPLNVNANSSATILVPTNTATTYTGNNIRVAYQTAPACLNSISGSVSVIITAPIAQTITGTTPLCSFGGTATWTSTTSGGTWSSATPAVATVNAASGLVAGVSSGTSVITYTVNVGGCANAATKTVTITTLPVATFSYSGTPYCQNASNPSPTFSGGGAAGIFSSTVGLNFVSTATGQVNLATSAAGTYTITNTIPAASGCGIVTATSGITINPSLPVSVSIGASANPVCLGTSVTYTATPTNGGTTPVYQWKVNGADAGTNSTTYVYAPASGDLVTCMLTSNATCATGNPATSNPVNMTVYQLIGNNALDYTNGVYGVMSAIPAENGNAALTAPAGAVFINVGFASYGTPNGTSPSFTLGACNALTSQSIVEGYLLGKNSASIPATNGVFGDPCSGTVKRLYVLTTYTQPICAGTSPGTITGSLPTGGNGIYTYLWESSITGPASGFVAASGTNNTQNYAAGNLTQTTWFRRTVTSAGCFTDVARVIQITVTALPVATFSYSGTPYCSNASNPTPTYSGGGVAGAFSSTSGLVFISNNTGQIDLTNSTPGSYTVTNTIIPSGGCAQVSATSPVSIVLYGSWTGAINTDWNTPGNWACNQLPTIATNVTIPNGKPNYPTLAAGVDGMANNLTIQNSSSVTVVGKTLQIAGTINNSGTFTATAGTIEMKGSTAQSIGAAVFSANTIGNLTINNAAGVTLLGPLKVVGIVKATTGNLISVGNLTLVSTSAQTALVDGSLTATGAITGNVTMQRYLPSGFGYKYFSSPFMAATVNEFANDINLAAAFPTLYRYNENHLTASLTAMSGWTAYTATVGLLNPMEGYAVNFGPVAAAKTADITGVLNNGALQINLLSHNLTYTKGFNLVGNPYPSPIDWNLAGWTKLNIDNGLYFFNAGSTDQYTGSYSSYINGVATGNGSNLIASMQGFFVHVTNGVFPVSAVLGVTNTVRTNDLNPLFKAAMVDDRAILRFTANFETEDAIADAAVIYFDENASMHFDREQDALKMLNTDILVPNLYTVSPDPEQLSINGMPLPIDSVTRIPLGITTLSDGWINFKAKDISQLPSDLNIYLVDAEMGITQDLNQIPAYRFFQKTGVNNERFSLIFSRSSLDKPIDPVRKMFTMSRSGDRLLVNTDLPLNTRGRMTLTNMAGQNLMHRDVFEKETVEISRYIVTGIYIVTVISEGRIQSEKILIRKDYE